MGRECAECTAILSIYNLSDRCSLHRTARDAQRKWLSVYDELDRD